MLHRYGSIYTGLIGSLRFQDFEIKRGDEGHYQRILLDVLGYDDIHWKNWDTLGDGGEDQPRINLTFGTVSAPKLQASENQARTWTGVILWLERLALRFKLRKAPKLNVQSRWTLLAEDEVIANIERKILGEISSNRSQIICAWLTRGPVPGDSNDAVVSTFNFQTNYHHDGPRRTGRDKWLQAQDMARRRPGAWSWLGFEFTGVATSANADEGIVKRSIK